MEAIYPSLKMPVVFFKYLLILKSIRPAMKENKSNLTYAECKCSPDSWKYLLFGQSGTCSKDTCCCLSIHKLPAKQFFINFYYVKTLFAAALGIEKLCISAAIIGENVALYLFGYNHRASH